MTELGLMLIATFIASGRTAPSRADAESGTDISSRNHARDRAQRTEFWKGGVTIHVNECGSAVR
jgi:hypothetical protein